MKKLFIALGFLLFANMTFAQCPDGNVVIYGNYMLDSLLLHYPNCTHLTGSLTIEPGAVNANEFYKKIERIDGSLYIIQQLPDLSLLSTVYGNMVVSSCHPTLPSLDSIYGKLTIKSLPYPAYSQVTNLDFLSGIDYIGGDFLVNDNILLENCSGVCHFQDDVVQGATLFGANKGVCYDTEFLMGSCGDLECPTGDVYLRVRSQVDAFKQAFPNCTEINGTLKMVPTSAPYHQAPATLDSLINITKINGSLDFYHVSGPNDYFWHGNTEGLANVNYVGGDISIRNIATIPLITKVQGNVSYQYGSFNLDTVPGNLYITGGGSAPNLKYIGGDIIDYLGYSLPVLEEIAGTLDMGGLPQIKTYVNLPSLKSFKNSNHLNSLHSFAGFGSLEYIGSSIGFGPNLTSFEGLEKLKTIAGNFILKSNSKITTTEGLNALSVVEGSMTIQDNSDLSNLNSLENLEEVGGNLAVVSNFGLTDCQGICNLLHNDGVVGGTVFSANPSPCSSLAEVLVTCAIDSIIVNDQDDANSFGTNHPGNTVDGDLIIGSVDTPISGLVNINGLSQLTTVTGNLIISYNNDLVSLAGLDNLTTVGKDLIISNNLKIEGIDALLNLSNVGGSIIVGKNAALINLNGLGGQSNIGANDDLIIKNNPLLAHLDGLEQIQSVGGDLEVKDNSTLSDCDGLCKLLGLDGVAGDIVITGNPSPCSNESEVLGECVVGVQDAMGESNFSVFPNPVHSVFSIVGKTPIQELTIWNTTGQLILAKKIDAKQVSIDYLPKGLYLLKVKMGSTYAFRKIVVE